MEFLIDTSVGFAVKFITFTGIFILTWLYYKKTIPDLSNREKAFLAVLRFISFSLLFFILYKIVIMLFYPHQEKQTVNVFIDNSASMMITDDSVQRKNAVNKFISSTRGIENISPKFFIFGDSLRPLISDGDLNFNDKITNFDLISSEMEKTKFAASVIISDGQWNSGSNPEILWKNNNEKPIYCIGVGDTSDLDYKVTDIKIPDHVFMGIKNKLSFQVVRNFFSKDTVFAELFSENKQIAKKKIIFKKSDISRKVDFNYIPDATGRKKIKFEINSNRKENNNCNNVIQKRINIYKKQYNILLMGGTPNPDVKKIKSITKDFALLNVITVFDIIKTNPPIPKEIDAVILWNFPNNLSNKINKSKIFNMINKNELPVWINITENTDINDLIKNFPFIKFKKTTFNNAIDVNAFNKKDNKFTLVFPNRMKSKKYWELLPPFKTIGHLLNWPDNNGVLYGKFGKYDNRYIPVLLRERQNNRVIWISSFENIWKWHSQLTIEPEFQNGLSRFIKKIIFSLILDEENENIKINFPFPDIYPLQETKFNVKVYEQDFSKMKQANARISIMHNDKNIFLQEKFGLQPEEGFDFTYHFPKSGEYKITSKIFKDSILINEKIEKIQVLDSDIEKLHSSMNKTLLSNIAFKTEGEFYNLNTGLEKSINKLRMMPLKNSFNEVKIKMKNNLYILLIIMLTLNIEWFFRKRWGLL